MIITNKFGLPAPIVAAVKRDDYTKGRADFSVTELLDSPRVRILRQYHDHEIERDASEFVWSLMGRALHRVLEIAGEASPDLITEHRFFTTVNGVTISGGVDLINDGEQLVIEDYKMTSAANVMKPKEDWEKQLNLYNVLYHRNTGRQADALRICAVIRDWQRSRAKRDPNYPQAPIVALPIHKWDLDVAERFLVERVNVHSQARADHAFSSGAPLCSDEERWMKSDTFAILHPKKKRAVKLLYSRDEAEKEQEALGDPHYIDVRKGAPTRCIDYCEAAPFCDQWQKEKDLYDGADTESGE